MGIKEQLADPDIFVVTAPIAALAVAAIAVLLPKGDASEQTFSIDGNPLASRFPIDITAPRHDLPAPKHFDKMRDNRHQHVNRTRRWGGYFPGGY